MVGSGAYDWHDPTMSTTNETNGSVGLNVACVEDVEADAVLIRRALDSSHLMSVENFLRVTDLRSLEQLFQDHPVDVVLLDLGLPDSSGIETIDRARTIVGATPLIVLTGDRFRGVESIANGADDFLSKDEIGGGHLARILAHAVERQRLVTRIARVENERELARIGSVGVPFSEARDAGAASTVDPSFIDHCQRAFTSVVYERLDAEGDTDEQVQVLYALGRQLATRIAGPEDVVQVLTATVEGERGKLGVDQFGPFVRECRLALIELMGHLLGQYRPFVPLAIRDEIEVIDGPVGNGAEVIGVDFTRSADDE